MKKVCIIGSGIGGSVLALELSKNPDLDITLVDVDSVNSSFKANLKLAKKFSPGSPSKKFQTVGYGFGGTSNLWHGVLTHLDDEDYEVINSSLSIDLKKDLFSRLDRLEFYFRGSKKLVKDITNNSCDRLEEYLENRHLLSKLYLVSKWPLRLRKLLRRLKSENLTFLENAIAISFDVDDRNNISCLNFSYSGSMRKIQADIFVVACGSLETPRLLLQSFRDNEHFNPNLGTGLMDHPVVFLGDLSLPQKILYKAHGTRQFGLMDERRFGYRFVQSSRSKKGYNHSIFVRPYFSKNILLVRKLIKEFIYSKNLFATLRLLKSVTALQVLATMIFEKVGIGYWTNKFLISMQVELVPSEKRKVILSNELDEYGRKIPIIYDTLEPQILDEIHHYMNLISKLVKGSAIFKPLEIKSEDILSGSHYSGSCRMGNNASSSVVDLNLKYHSLNNLYVSDGSVLPKVGNANLSLTIALMALRLSDALQEA